MSTRRRLFWLFGVLLLVAATVVSIVLGRDLWGDEDSAELQALFESVPDGTAEAPTLVTFPEGAEYIVNASLVLEDRQHLIIDGNGATLRNTTPSTPDIGRPVLWLLRGSHITVQNLNIRGIGDGTFDEPFEEDHGVKVQGTPHVTLRALDIRNMPGDGVFVTNVPSGEGGSLARVTDLLIEQSNFEDVGRMSWTVNDASGVVIQDNSAFGARSILDLEPPRGGQMLDRLTLQRNEFGGARNFFFTAGGLGTMRNIHITDNHSATDDLHSNFDTGGRWVREGLVFARNVSDVQMDGQTIGAMLTVGAQNVLVEANVQPINAGQSGYIVGVDEDTCGVLIQDNIALGAGGVWKGQKGAVPAEGCIVEENNTI